MKRFIAIILCSLFVFTGIAASARDATTKPDNDVGIYGFHKTTDATNVNFVTVSNYGYNVNHFYVEVIYSFDFGTQPFTASWSPEIRVMNRSYPVIRSIGKTDTKRHIRWLCEIMKLC